MLKNPLEIFKEISFPDRLLGSVDCPNLLSPQHPSCPPRFTLVMFLIAQMWDIPFEISNIADWKSDGIEVEGWVIDNCSF